MSFLIDVDPRVRVPIPTIDLELLIMCDPDIPTAPSPEYV
jgi:hypothetical protein